MGVKRRRQREQERETARLVRRHFVATPAEFPVTCANCGRKFRISVPAVPKKGGVLHIVRACECGTEVSLTLTGRDDEADPDPAPD